MVRDYKIKMAGLLLIVLLIAAGLLWETYRYNTYNYYRNIHMNGVSTFPMYNTSGKYIQNDLNTNNMYTPNGIGMGSCMRGY